MLVILLLFFLSISSLYNVISFSIQIIKKNSYSTGQEFAYDDDDDDAYIFHANSTDDDDDDSIQLLKSYKEVVL